MLLLALLLTGLLSAEPPLPTFSDHDVKDGIPILGFTARWETDYCQFRDLALRHFDDWSIRRDAYIHSDYLMERVGDPQIQGESAAALASMTRVLWVFRGDILENNSLEKGDLQMCWRLAGCYRLYRDEILATRMELFVPDASLSLAGIKQGKIGKSSDLAPIGSLVHARPDAVRQLIKQDGTGYLVCFPGSQKPIHVDPLTDAQIALTPRTGGQGMWCKVLAMVAKQHPGNEGPMISDVFGTAVTGNAGSTIAMLTGHQCDKCEFSPTDFQLRWLNLRMQKAIAKKQIIVTRTNRRSENNPPCIPSGPDPVGHDFAVVGVDEKSVHLWNPWGNDFTPTGEPGLENGYPTKDGRFSVPLDHFPRIFDTMYFESDRPIDFKEVKPQQP